MNDIPQVNLVAAVGPGGSLGPKVGLPLFVDPVEARIYEDWFLELVYGGVVLLDRTSAHYMRDSGFLTMPEGTTLAIWDEETPAYRCLPGLQQHGVPIFIVGSGRLYEEFMPFVQQFFIRRVALKGPHETFFPKLFGNLN